MKSLLHIVITKLGLVRTTNLVRHFGAIWVERAGIVALGSNPPPPRQDDGPPNSCGSGFVFVVIASRWLTSSLGAVPAHRGGGPGRPQRGLATGVPRFWSLCFQGLSGLRVWKCAPLGTVTGECVRALVCFSQRAPQELCSGTDPNGGASKSNLTRGAYLLPGGDPSTATCLRAGPVTATPTPSWMCTAPGLHLRSGRHGR